MRGAHFLLFDFGKFSFAFATLGPVPGRAGATPLTWFATGPTADHVGTRPMTPLPPSSRGDVCI